ncbi:MAG TPA: phage minor head protein [Chitinophagales bacterium]|nr:phage minor head protein [Chitinophagales bacterium]
MIRATALKLFDGVKKGFDGNVTPDNYNIDQYTTLRKMRENVFVFSGFKDYHQIKEMSMLLTDSKGNIRSFDDFYKDVKQVNETYNIHYLQAEYDHAVSTGTMAAKWDKFKTEADLFPMLRYRALHDGRTRQEHLALDGATYPIGHEFWKTYLPPNGWRCRCDVDQVEKQAIREPKSKPVLKPMFRNNVGVDGVVFPNTHPVFDNDEIISEAAKNGATIARFSDPDENGYQLVYKSMNRKSVMISYEHKLDDIKYNFNKARIITDANNGVNLKLRPFVETSGIKNPELEFSNGWIGDFKEPEPDVSLKTSIETLLKRAKLQGCNLPIFVINNKYYDKMETIRALNNSLKIGQKEAIKEVWFLFDKKLIKITRDEIYSKKYYNKLP